MDIKDAGVGWGLFALIFYLCEADQVKGFFHNCLSSKALSLKMAKQELILMFSARLTVGGHHQILTYSGSRDGWRKRPSLDNRGNNVDRIPER